MADEVGTGAAGWYWDAASPTLETYFDGRQWLISGRRPRTGVSKLRPAEMPGLVQRKPRSPQGEHSSAALLSAGYWMYTLATLAGLAAIIGGIVLLVKSKQSCTAVSGNSDLITCDGSTHPYLVAGIAVLAGGLVLAAVIYTVGYVCKAVAEMKSS